MPEIGEVEKIWLDFVIKLNDRFLAKQRASGFTSYAVMALVGFLFYGIFDKISATQPFSAHISLFITTLCNTANIFFSVIFLIACLSIVSNPSKETRLSTTSSYVPGIIVSIMIFFYWIVVIMLNTYVIYNINDLPISKMPYKLFNSCVGILFFALLFDKIRLLRKRRNLLKELKNKNIELPRLSSLSFSDFPFKKSLTLFIFCIIIFLLISSIVSLVNLFLKTEIINNIFIVKLSCELILLYIFIFILLKKQLTFSSQAFLENLERKILLENINTNEIKKLFVNEYFGQSTKEWLTILQNEMDNMCKEVLDAIINANDKLDEIQDIDKKLIYEIKGRKDNLCESVSKPFDEYSNFTEEKMAQITFLISQKAFIYSESELLKQLMLSWKNQVSELKNKYKSFCDKYKSISCDNSTEECKEEMPNNRMKSDN